MDKELLLRRCRNVIFINVLVNVLLAAIFSVKIGWENSMRIFTLMCIAGSLDFFILYQSIRYALAEKDSNMLQVMRNGMGARFFCALIGTVIAIYMDFIPWAILLGILLSHVVLLVDLIVISWRLKPKSQNNAVRKEE